MLEVRFSSLRCQLGSQISSGSAAPRFGAVRAGCQQCGCLQAHRDDRPFIVQVDPSLPSNCLDRSGIGREVFSWREMTPRRFRRQARLSYVDRDSFGMPVLAVVEVYLSQAQILGAGVSYVDLNLGCPQRCAAQRQSVLSADRSDGELSSHGLPITQWDELLTLTSRARSLRGVSTRRAGEVRQAPWQSPVDLQPPFGQSVGAGSSHGQGEPPPGLVQGSAMLSSSTAYVPFMIALCCALVDDLLISSAPLWHRCGSCQHSKRRSHSHACSR